MRFKIIILLLAILSFNIFHDSLICIVDNKNYTDIISYENSGESQNTNINEIHNLLHFIAIIIQPQLKQPYLTKEQNLAYSSLYYHLRYDETSYKPPINIF